MSISEHETDYDEDIFSLSLDDDTPSNNKRIAVRYVRDDITVTLTKRGLINFSEDLSVKLLDISSKGAAISSDNKLTVKKKIILSLLFKDGKSFTITAKVIHKINNKNHYGIQFDEFNNELGEHLLSTQHDLLFK